MTSSSPHDPAPRRMPLCVDMDGTLVAGDTLHESLVWLARRRPGLLWRVPAWLRRGRAGFKRRVADAVVPDAAALPYRSEVLAYVREARAAGRPVVLATAADRRVAEAVAGHLGLFDRVLATEDDHNLKGDAKRRALEEAFGPRGYEYLGDHGVDRAVWEGAARIACVGVSDAEARRLEAHAPVVRRFERPSAGPGTWLRAMRVHQWVKNVLLFVPLLAAHRVDEPLLWAVTLLAFLAFSLCASGVYLLNDLMDLEADRLHPTKRHRPMAAGRLPLLAGAMAAPLLVAGALAGSALLLPAGFVAALAVYLVLNALYTFVLKQVAIADVIFLASLYSLRVLAGGLATGIPVSPWLIGFSLFFFLSLAVLKRYADLRILEASGSVDASPGRDYSIDDAALLLAMGPACGYMAVVVLVLYVQSEAVEGLYRTPELLWLLAPLLVYWISRVWWIAHRGRMTDDPIVFTSRDPASWLVGVLALATLTVATLL